MILRGKKVILRPIRFSDAGRFVKWLSDPEVNKFTTRKGITLKEEKKWIKSLAKKKDERHFAIDTKDGVHIGSIGLHPIRPRDKNAGFDILIGDKDYWNKGCGTDAIKAILDYAFQRLKLHRVDLKVYVYNKRAIRVYEKLGFKKEGTERERILFGGKFVDDFIMGLLDREWRKIRKTLV